MTLPLALVLAACAIAAVTDVTARRIPNLVTLALAIAGLVVHAIHGWAELGIALLTTLVVLAWGTYAFSRRWLGGGDVKLLAACSLVLSFPDALPFLTYTALFGGLVAGAFLVYNLKSRHSIAFVSGGLPYGLAIAGGAVLLALSRTVAPAIALHG